MMKQDIKKFQRPGLLAEWSLGQSDGRECMGITSSIDTKIPITLIHVRMESESLLTQQFDSKLNGMIYVFGGEISLENEMRVKANPLAFGIGARQQIQDGELALLSEGDEITIKSNSNSEFLILAGPELNEPIERYGPFVMNTRGNSSSTFRLSEW